MCVDLKQVCFLQFAIQNTMSVKAFNFQKVYCKSVVSTGIANVPCFAFQ